MRGSKRKMGKYLSCSIDNLGCIVLVLVANNLAKSILNGRIVAVDKVAVDELYRQTRLAYTGRVSVTSHMQVPATIKER